MDSPVPPTVANLNMKEVGNRAVSERTTTSHWFRYVDYTWVKIKAQVVEAFTEHISSADSNITFTRGYEGEQVTLPVMCCTPWEGCWGQHWSLPEAYSARPLPPGWLPPLHCITPKNEFLKSGLSSLPLSKEESFKDRDFHFLNIEDRTTSTLSWNSHHSRLPLTNLLPQEVTGINVPGAFCLWRHRKRVIRMDKLAS